MFIYSHFSPISNPYYSRPILGNHFSIFYLHTSIDASPSKTCEVILDTCVILYTLCCSHNSHSIFLFFYSVFLKSIYIAMYTASLQIIFYIPHSPNPSSGYVQAAGLKSDPGGRRPFLLIRNQDTLPQPPSNMTRPPPH